MQIIYLEPFPEEVKSYLEKAENVYVVEENAVGQLADLITRNTGFIVKNRILKLDGRPFTAKKVVEGINKARNVNG